MAILAIRAEMVKRKTNNHIDAFKSMTLLGPPKRLTAGCCNTRPQSDGTGWQVPETGLRCRWLGPPALTDTLIGRLQANYSLRPALLLGPVTDKLYFSVLAVPLLFRCR